jgi:hypothetical protein
MMKKLWEEVGDTERQLEVLRSSWRLLLSVKVRGKHLWTLRSS